jgi:hypothetical protein
MSEVSTDFKEVAQEFGHALAALMDTTKTLNDANLGPAVLASATCANYVGYVATMSKLIGLTPDEAFDTCVAGVHQMRAYVEELYAALSEDKKGAA